MSNEKESRDPPSDGGDEASPRSFLDTVEEGGVIEGRVRHRVRIGIDGRPLRKRQQSNEE